MQKMNKRSKQRQRTNIKQEFDQEIQYQIVDKNAQSSSNRQNDKTQNSKQFQPSEELFQLNIKYYKNIQKAILFKQFEYDQPSIYFASVTKSLSNNIDYIKIHLSSSFLNLLMLVIIFIVCQSRFDTAQNPNYILIAGLLILMKFVQEFDFFHNKDKIWQIWFFDVYLGLIFKTFTKMGIIKLVLSTFQINYLSQSLITVLLGPIYFSFFTVILTLNQNHYRKYLVESKIYKIIKNLSMQNTYSLISFLGVYYFFPQFQYKTFYNLKLFQICLIFSIIQVIYLFSVILTTKIQNFEWQTSRQIFGRLFFVYATLFMLIQIFVVKNHFLAHPITRLLLEINFCLFIAELIGKKQIQRLTRIKQKTFNFQSCIFFINLSLLIVWGLLNKKYDEFQELMIINSVLKLLTCINFVFTLYSMRSFLKKIVK